MHRERYVVHAYVATNQETRELLSELFIVLPELVKSALPKAEVTSQEDLNKTLNFPLRLHEKKLNELLMQVFEIIKKECSATGNDLADINNFLTSKDVQEKLRHRLQQPA